MSNWVENLRVLNISADNNDGATADRRLPRPHKDNARQTLQAFLGAGLGGRDDAPVPHEWVPTQPTRHVRTLEDPLSISQPFDDEIREVLPSLVAAQRSDAFFRTGFYLFGGSDEGPVGCMAAGGSASGPAPRSTSIRD